jgi:hypothetical protein
MSAKSSKMADAVFRKQDKQAAVTEYHRLQKVEKEKGARLRALRLAKQAADQEAASLAEAEKAAKKKPAVKRRKKATAPAEAGKATAKKPAAKPRKKAVAKDAAASD